MSTTSASIVVGNNDAAVVAAADDDDDDANNIWMRKIQMLTRHDDDSYSVERKLVALTILTRTKTICVDQNLIQFAVQVLPQSLLYTRLVAQFVYQLSILTIHHHDDDKDNNTKRKAAKSANIGLQTIGEALLRHYCCDSAEHSVRVRCEMLVSLQAWLEHCQDLERLDTILAQLWHRQQDFKTNSKNHDNVVLEYEQVIEKQSTAQLLMDQTLTSLLDQSSNILDRSLSSLVVLEQEIMAELLLRHGERVAMQIGVPSIWRTILKHWLQQQPPNTTESVLRQSQAQALLGMLLQSMTYHSDGSVVEECTLQISQLVLACVVTTVNNNELRVMAWMTVATLIRYAGWGWLQQRPSHNSNRSIGLRSQQCTIIRLAVGECKIQMEALLNQVEGHDVKVNEEEDLPQYVLIEVCAQIVLMGMDDMLQLCDSTHNKNDDDNNRVEEKSEIATIPGDAVLHIRQSFEEALDSAVQYLGLTERRNHRVDSTVVRLFALLLTEFDAFNRISFLRLDGSNNKNSSAECAVLQALSRAIMIAAYDVHLQELLLPSLATVFATAEGVPLHESLLVEYGLLGESLLNFLNQYLRSTTDLASITWACQLIELWVGMGSVSETSTVQAALVDFLRRNILLDPTSKLIEAFTHIIGCYVTLQGDYPPCEPDASLLQQTLELCASFERR